MENSLYNANGGRNSSSLENLNYPSAPPTAPLYPDVNKTQVREDVGLRPTFREGEERRQVYTCNSQQFRLVEIQKMRDDLETRIKTKEIKCKRYKKQTIATEAVSAALSTVSVLSGSSAAVSALPVITIPLAIPMGVLSAVTGATSAVILLISRNRRKKMVANVKTLIDEKTVYNSIVNYISKAIDDKFITDDEFQFIRKMYTPLVQKNRGRG